VRGVRQVRPVRGVREVRPFGPFGRSVGPRCRTARRSSRASCSTN
jgi:hypothetical protein